MQKDKKVLKSKSCTTSDMGSSGLSRILYTGIIFIISSLLTGGVYFLKDIQYKSEKVELQQKISELDNTIKLLKSKNESKEKELCQQKDNYDSQIEKLQQEIKALANNKTDFSSRISDLVIENNTLRQRYNDLHQAMSLLKGNDGEKLKDVIALRANETVTALKNKDMKKLSSIVHPQKGVRFSPYAYIDIKKHKVLTADQIEKILNDNTKYVWGNFDGSGDPINMTFKEYLERFVYNKDYANSDKVGFNEALSGGNTINNVFEIYPEAVIVEYFISGTNPNYGGMDWGSLKLVFEESGGVWYLIGVIHNEWTI